MAGLAFGIELRRHVIRRCHFLLGDFGDDVACADVLLTRGAIGIHIRDDLIKDGRVDIVSTRPIARLGYSEYAVIDGKFRMPFPD